MMMSNNMMMNNNMMNNNNVMLNNHMMNNYNSNNNNMNNNNMKHNNNAKVNMTYDFIVKDSNKNQEFNIKVQGNSQFSIQKLIKGFRVKLCNDDAVIKEYKLNGTTHLDENSNETLAQKGINENQKIYAYM
jgi:hypothetical protein